MLGGVCGGLAEHWGLDAKLIRVFFLVSAMVSGLGAVLYIVLWLITPPAGMNLDAERDQIMRMGKAEISAEARHLGDNFQQALHHEDTQARLTIRLAVAILAGLALKKMRQARRKPVSVMHKDKPKDVVKEAQESAVDEIEAWGQGNDDVEA
jgi:phage shock protein PspC (stress-responsive transcriptional regulator)